MKADAIKPMNIAIPPKEGVNSLCIFLRSGASNIFLLFEKDIITGIIKKVTM